MKMRFGFALIVLVTTCNLVLHAQPIDESTYGVVNPSTPTEAPKEKELPEVISLSGSIDSYFHKSFGTIENAPRTSFSNLPGFSLGMVNLIGTYAGRKSGFVIDLVLGPRGVEAVFNAPLYKNPGGGGSSHIINQMFAYYKLSEKVKFNFGQFNTFIGYEYITPLKNFHYGTSYLFSYGPFNHTGLWIDIDWKNGWIGKLAVMNPTDYTEYNPFNSFTLGGQIGFESEARKIYMNLTYGDPDGKLQSGDSVGTISKGNALQFDVTAYLNLDKKYQIGFNGSYRSTQSGDIRTASSKEKSSKPTPGFYGIAFYQKMIITDQFNLGLRTEYFDEFHGGAGAIGEYDSFGHGTVLEFTLSANIVADNLRFIPEVRMDKTSLDSFTRETDNAPVASMCSFNLAMIYAIPVLEHEIHRKK